MSYCRMNKRSDVYVYMGSTGLVCCGCLLVPPAWYLTDSHLTMIKHLLWHMEEGHKVPKRAIDRLLKEYYEKNMKLSKNE